MKLTPRLWAGEIEEWALTLTAAGMSKGTVRNRTDHMRRVARALDGDPWQVDAEQLLAWAGQQAWARETRRNVYQSIKEFWAWGIASGKCTCSPEARLPKVRPGEPLPRPTPDSVLEQALHGCDNRTRLILRCAAEAGLRRAEIAVIQASDLSRDLTGWSLLVHGKGDKLRTVPLGDGLARALRTSCLAGGGWAFPGDDRGHLSPRWVGKLATRVLPGEWTLHSLRHRFATRAHEGTHDLVAVQRLLGHSSVATTQRYVATPQDAMRRAMNAAA